MEYNISYEAENMKVTENTKIFIVTEHEIMSKTYRISGVNSRAEAQAYIDEHGVDSYSYFDNNQIDQLQCVEIGETDYIGSKIKKIEMQRVSPCTFKGKSFSGMRKHWREGEPPYKSFYTCGNNVKAMKSEVCTHCMRKIQNGWSIDQEEE